jgi:hypothetical protein
VQRTQKIKQQKEESSKALDVDPKKLQPRLPDRPFPPGYWPKENLKNPLLPRGDSLDSILNPVDVLLKKMG